METPKDFRDIFDRGHALIADSLYSEGWLQRPGTGYDPVRGAWPDQRPFAVVELRRLNGSAQVLSGQLSKVQAATIKKTFIRDIK